MKRLYLLLIILPLFLAAEERVPKPPYQGFLNNLEEGEFLTVYSEPGVNSSTCERIVDDTNTKVCKLAVAWPDRKSHVQVLSEPFEREITNPSTGKKEIQKYVEVQVTYRRLNSKGDLIIQDKKGFIEYQQIYTKPLDAFYGTGDKAVEPPKKKKDCPPKVASPKSKETQDIVKPLQQVVRNLGVTKSADMLKHLVGFCITDPPDKFPSSLPTGNAYDRLVLPKIKAIKPPAILKSNGQKMSSDDLVDIDALARTLYGEMNGCYKHGLHYPMAIAKVIMNRSVSPNQREQFIQKSPPDGKPLLSRVATEPSQFTMWQSRSNNRPLHQGLCPGRQRGKPFYHSNEASREEEEIWNNTVRIATEAVLYPEEFKKRTSQVRYTHYTSDKAKDRKTERLNPGATFINYMDQRRPQIDGRTVNYNPCLELWEENPELMRAKIAKEHQQKKAKKDAQKKKQNR